MNLEAMQVQCIPAPPSSLIGLHSGVTCGHNLMTGTSSWG